MNHLCSIYYQYREKQQAHCDNNDFSLNHSCK